MGPERQDADADCLVTAELRRADEDALGGVDALLQRAGRPVVRACGAKGDDRELRLRNDLDAGDLAQALGGVAGEVELLVQGATEGVDTVHLDREPEA